MPHLHKKGRSILLDKTAGLEDANSHNNHIYAREMRDRNKMIF